MRGVLTRLTALVLTVLSMQLYAAIITVNDLGDAADAIPSDNICATAGSVCTLRAAIQTANSIGGTNVINVPSGTITLASNLGLGSNITVNGVGTGSTIISGNGVAQVFVFVQNGINVAMNDLTITGGVSSQGAGIFATTSSTLSLTRVLVTNNNATLTSKQGGGLFIAGTLNLTDSTVSNNSAANGGGGIRLNATGTANITNSTISGNSTSSVGAGGGGIESLGTLNITNSTFSGNTIGDGSGAGIEVAGGDTTISFTTITANSSVSTSGQLSRFGTGVFIIRGSIVANPAAGINCAGLSAANSGGNNLDSGNTCGFTAAGDLINSNPLLAALANNGGLTQTHALQAGSPAINAGPTTGTIPANDQRGTGFPRVVGAQADIGAFESSAIVAPTAPVVSVGNASIVEGNAGTSVLNFPVTLSAAAPSGGVVITYSTANGTATAGSDYVAVVAGSVTIAQGATTGSLPVTINGDTTVEPNETFTVTISNATNATVGTATATGTIQNDDAVVLPVLTLSDASITEGNAGTSVLNFPITLSSAAPVGGVTITYSTANGTATAGSDYVAVVAGTVTIAAGATAGSLPVTIIGDTTLEADETFTVTMTNVTNATISGALAPKTTATGTILNDDVFVRPTVVTGATPVPVDSPWALLLVMLGVIGFTLCERRALKAKVATQIDGGRRV